MADGPTVVTSGGGGGTAVAIIIAVIALAVVLFATGIIDFNGAGGGVPGRQCRRQRSGGRSSIRPCACGSRAGGSCSGSTGKRRLTPFASRPAEHLGGPLSTGRNCMSTPEERENRAARTDREAWMLLEAERKARDAKTARLRALRQAANEPLLQRSRAGRRAGIELGGPNPPHDGNTSLTALLVGGELEVGFSSFALERCRMEEHDHRFCCVPEPSGNLDCLGQGDRCPGRLGRLRARGTRRRPRQGSLRDIEAHLPKPPGRSLDPPGGKEPGGSVASDWKAGCASSRPADFRTARQSLRGDPLYQLGHAPFAVNGSMCPAPRPDRSRARRSCRASATRAACGRARGRPYRTSWRPASLISP